MSQESVAREAIQSVLSGQLAFCKFLTANDTGETKAHQAGIYIPKPAVPMIFDKLFEKGSNYERWASIDWHDGRTTISRFIYYGKGTRNEYRITNFGRGFEYLHPEHTGDLFVLVKNDNNNYSGFFLAAEDEIDEFLATFSLSPADTGKPIYKENEPTQPSEITEFKLFYESLNKKFPTTEVMSGKAREIELLLNDRVFEIVSNPDKKIIAWSEVEYRLFRYIENALYSTTYEKGFPSLDDFLTAANSFLQRRKSRAGKSLEHHLSFIFKQNKLVFSEQPLIEENKKPDFIFPGISEYRNPSYPRQNLIFLAAKTTCKDRWRQILNEADQISTKHLFTLQQGISSQQLMEMEKSKVVLVVPADNISTFPPAYRPKILTLREFISQIRQTNRI
ncbi:MAG: type II restriction endonuclease [Anaerolineaceae bacterium]